MLRPYDKAFRQGAQRRVIRWSRQVALPAQNQISSPAIEMQARKNGRFPPHNRDRYKKAAPYRNGQIVAVSGDTVPTSRWLPARKRLVVSSTPALGLLIQVLGQTCVRYSTTSRTLRLELFNFIHYDSPTNPCQSVLTSSLKTPRLLRLAMYASTSPGVVTQTVPTFFVPINAFFEPDCVNNQS